MKYLIYTVNLLGFLMVYSCIFPPLYAKKKKQKDLIHFLNLSSMNDKQRIKLFWRVFIGFTLMIVSREFQ